MSDSQQQAWTAPRLPQAQSDPNNPGHQYLTIDRIYGIPEETLVCEVPMSAGMESGDIVRVRGRFGEVLYDAPQVSIPSQPRTLSVAMPKFMLYGAAGNVMTLNFALKKSNGGDWQPSQSRDVRVQPQAMTLERPALPHGSRNLQISYDAMAIGHKVRARLYSSPTQFVDTQEVTVTRVGPVAIEIYRSWFEANRGKPVWLNYSILVNGNSRRLISKVLYIEQLEVPTD